MLKVDGIDTNYGVVAMLRDVSFDVAQASSSASSGRTAPARRRPFAPCRACFPSPVAASNSWGTISRDMRTESLSALGIGFVPEGRRLFAEITVRDNIRLGFEAQKAKGAFSDCLEQMLSLFPRVRERINQRAGTLSGGEQTMVALARALIGAPRLVIMDEPSLGLSPKLIDEYFDTVAEINRRGTTVLLIEQNAETALSIAHRGVILVKGRVVASGKASELLNNDAVRHLYL